MSQNEKYVVFGVRYALKWILVPSFASEVPWDTTPLSSSVN